MSGYICLKIQMAEELLYQKQYEEASNLYNLTKRAEFSYLL
ncbi:hypothetical protein [Clostridium grantii]|uniref:Uncharacterized protein n=1 Tax=Clostridium grantii DSM 8605 TaxID=1121316 RepID=A0A1M5VFA4_9CLOT|nr:hypothetical protein [Clostridium grantii]SHH73972.1 hypothetical protein SAMN02745207_02271 [Clostridium grantii DSM 8605]